MKPRAQAARALSFPKKKVNCDPTAASLSYIIFHCLSECVREQANILGPACTLLGDLINADSVLSGRKAAASVRRTLLL